MFGVFDPRRKYRRRLSPHCSEPSLSPFSNLGATTFRLNETAFFGRTFEAPNLSIDGFDSVMADVL
jgi:hypothetical protein